MYLKKKKLKKGHFPTFPIVDCLYMFYNLKLTRGTRIDFFTQLQFIILRKTITFSYKIHNKLL